MDPKSVDDRIAEERHKALAYSTYTSGKVAPKGPAKKSSPFIRFSYVPKRTIILASLAGLLLIGGVASAVIRVVQPEGDMTSKNSGDTSEKGSGETVTYSGEETNRDGTKATEDSSDKKAGSSNNIVGSAFESLGLIKKTDGSTSGGGSGSTGGSNGGGNTGTPTGGGTGDTPGGNDNNTPTTKITKLVVFVEENHSLSQMKANMPYAFSLAKKYAYANNYFAIRHPSLPNYIAIASGSTRGITNDAAPSSNGFSGTSVFGQAINNNKTAKLYVESLPSNCKLSNSGKYAVKHNPWAYVSSERSLCNKYDVNMTAFTSDVSNAKLPNVSMVIPNLCNDAHDCSLATADNWFKARMQQITAGQDWKSGKLLVVLTADEDDKNSDNKVLTVLIHPSLKSKVGSCKLTHYSLSRLYSEVTHTTPILNAKNAASMKSCFGLPI